MSGVPPEQAQKTIDYCKETMRFVPRMFVDLAHANPKAVEQFADFYKTVFGDGAISQKHKELTVLSIAVTYQSPACLSHVTAAIDCGATDAEIFEAVQLGTIYTGFLPNSVGIPYAFAYAKKVLEIAGKYRKGEPWEYLTPPEFSMGR